MCVLATYPRSQRCEEAATGTRGLNGLICVDVRDGPQVEVGGLAAVMEFVVIYFCRKFVPSKRLL